MFNISLSSAYEREKIWRDTSNGLCESILKPQNITEWPYVTSVPESDASDRVIIFTYVIPFRFWDLIVEFKRFSSKILLFSSQCLQIAEHPISVAFWMRLDNYRVKRIGKDIAVFLQCSYISAFCDCLHAGCVVISYSFQCPYLSGVWCSYS